MPQSPGFDADPAVERLAEEGNEVGEEARVGARFCARHQTLRNPPYWPEFPTLACWCPVIRVFLPDRRSDACLWAHILVIVPGNHCV